MQHDCMNKYLETHFILIFHFHWASAAVTCNSNPRQMTNIMFPHVLWLTGNVWYQWCNKARSNFGWKNYLASLRKQNRRGNRRATQKQLKSCKFLSALSYQLRVLHFTFLNILFNHSPQKKDDPKTSWQITASEIMR